jgi:hypothetical protein
MGTDDSETSAMQVTMIDFKALESTVTSQMNELHEMIAQLMQAKFPSATPLPDILTTPHVENAGLEEEVIDKDKDNEQD